MGLVRDPYAAVWAGIDPYFNRLMIRMGFGRSERFFGFSFFRCFCRKLVFGFSIFFGGADGVQGRRGWAGTWPRATVFDIRTHTDTYWAPMGSQGAQGAQF